MSIEQKLREIEQISTSATERSVTLAPGAATTYRPVRLPLNYNTETTEQKLAYNATQLWLNDIIHNFKERSRWLVLYGAPGAGKTHLLNNAATILREFRRKVLTKRAADIATAVREGNTHSLHNIWAPAPILCIDDFGSEYHTEYITSVWFDLLDKRIGNNPTIPSYDRTPMWTLITTNLTPLQIESRYDKRIASRFLDSRNTLVDLTSAEDYRQTFQNLADF